VFAEVVTGFAEVATPGAGSVPDRLPMLLLGTAPGALLGGFLDDLLHLAVDERFVATRLERLTIGNGELRAAVSGWTGPVELVVTNIAGSDLRHDRAGWHAQVRFDTEPGDG
jgi:hypothetical protein